MKTILISDNSQFQRQSFSILSSEEKIQFLKAYLTMQLDRFEGEATKTSYIKELISEIDNNLIQPEGKGRTAILDYRAKSIFSADEYKNLFYKISCPPSLAKEKKSSSASKVDVFNSSEYIPDCHCGVTAVSLCNVGMSCDATPGCNKTESGCYFLFLYPCDGLCFAA